VNVKQSKEFIQDFHHFPRQQTVFDVQMEVVNHLRFTLFDFHYSAYTSTESTSG